MSGFSDLIPAAMPFLATEKIAGVAGATWSWSYDVRDDAGALVDMTTGYTGTCQIRETDGTLVVGATVSFPSAGIVKCAVLQSNTTGLAAGHYELEVEVTRDSDGVVVKIVGGGRSHFDIYSEVVA